MLHDPGSYTPPLVIDEIDLEADEKENLRGLGREIAAIAADPVNAERAELWRRLNDLDPGPPHGLDQRDPLARDERRRRADARARATLGARPGDASSAARSTSGGTCRATWSSATSSPARWPSTAPTSASSRTWTWRGPTRRTTIVSRHFNIQIRDLADLEKIRMPVVTHDRRGHRVRFRGHVRLFDGILPVRKVGQTHIWFTPWDYLIRWWGIEEAMIDLVERPDLVHAAVERMVDAWMTELDQFEALNLLSLDCDNTRIGSGGYGYTCDLPGGELRSRAASGRTTCGAARTRRSSPRSRRRCTGSSPCEHDLRWLAPLGPDLLRLLRAAGPQGGSSETDPEPAEGFGQPLERLRDHIRGDRHELRRERETQPGHLSRRRVERRHGPRRDRGRARPGRGRWRSRRAHHEGHKHRTAQAAAALGLGPDRGRGSAKKALTPRSHRQMERGQYATLPGPPRDCAR